MCESVRAVVRAVAGEAVARRMMLGWGGDVGVAILRGCDV